MKYDVDLRDFLIIKKDLPQIKKGIYEIYSMRSDDNHIHIKDLNIRLLLQPVLNAFRSELRSHEYHQETKSYKILQNNEVHTLMIDAMIDNDDLCHFQENDEYIKTQSIRKIENKIKTEYLKEEYKKDKEVHYINQIFNKTVSTNKQVKTVYNYRVEFIIDIIDWSGFRSREEYNEYYQI